MIGLLACRPLLDLINYTRHLALISPIRLPTGFRPYQVVKVSSPLIHETANKPPWAPRKEPCSRSRGLGMILRDRNVGRAGDRCSCELRRLYSFLRLLLTMSTISSRLSVIYITSIFLLMLARPSRCPLAGWSPSHPHSYLLCLSPSLFLLSPLSSPLFLPSQPRLHQVRPSRNSLHCCIPKYQQTIETITTP